MKKILLSVALFLFASVALAGTATVTIVGPPTKYEDGTPLTVAGYKIYRGTCGGTKTVAGTGNQTSFSLTATPGQCFTASAFDANGTESAQTAEAVYHGLPGAPGSITITIVITQTVTP